MVRDRYVVLLHINRNSYMESPTAPLDLTLGDFERSKSRSPRFQNVISRNGAILGPMILLTMVGNHIWRVK